MLRLLLKMLLDFQYKFKKEPPLPLPLILIVYLEKRLMLMDWNLNKLKSLVCRVKLENSEWKFWFFELKLTYFIGLFAGGTHSAETTMILKKMQSDHKEFAGLQMDIIDLGDDEYCVGKPHPMIDGTTRYLF